MSEEIENLICEWLREDPEFKMHNACCDQPETAWQVILRLVELDLTEDQRALLAGGPVENLLALHGPQFIDRVEREAKVNPRFNHLLGGVWRQEMPEEIWDRIVRVRREVW